jgi:hypothetical protein
LSRKSRLLLRAAAVLLAWAALLPADAAPARAGWVAARRMTPADTVFTGTYILGGAGDYILENDRIVVVLSDTRQPSPYALSGGNIIDAGLRAQRIDGLMELNTYFDDDYPRQAVYDVLEIVNDGTGGGPAAIRASGLDSQNPYITVVTEYSLAAGADNVHISTTLVNGGGSSLTSFELGDAFLWGDCAKYVPGYGFAIWGDAVSPWVAGTTGQVSYGYVASDGTDVSGEHKDLWSHINLQTATLAPGEPVVYERDFVVGGRDIASVATAVHAVTGEPAGSLMVTVVDSETSTPLVACKIDVLDESEDPYLQMQTDAGGTAFTTLPAGTWRLETDRDGYQPSEITLSIADGGHLTQEFAIEEITTVIPGMGDTLTVIQRPLLNIPSFVMPGDNLLIECDAHPTVTGWEATLLRGGTEVPLEIVSSTYNPSTLWWSISAAVPAVPAFGLYDLTVSAAGGIVDTTRHAVEVIPEYKHDYYFIHITDTHLPTHRFYYEAGSDTDSSEMVDLRAVIQDINIINPEFVLITGDFINEGELEDFLNRRYYSKAQRMLTEFEVPTFLIAGNHDIGGWEDTPPPDGTARRDWWRFFGWKRLDSPPPGAPWYTQNYSFDYGPVHYVALEAYDNYDRWRYSIYGSDSFTQGQMNWLRDNLAAASGSSAQVLFYHYDFSRQLNLQALGVEMALWGHIHRDAGNINMEPYNLATRSLCDGNRSYRLIRVSGGTLDPSPTVSAGNAGRNLEVDFEPANNGTRDSVTAYITNNLNERFEHAMLQFLMPSGCDSLMITGGTLIAAEEMESLTRYYVGVDILPASTAEVTVRVDSCGAPGDTTGADRFDLARNKPNPFNPRTFLSFTLPATGSARLAIYDVQGREVKVLVDGSLDPGPHDEEWDGTDHHGRPANSGVYFARLTFAGQDRVVKMVLMR